MEKVTPSSHELRFSKKPKEYQNHKTTEDTSLVKIHGAQFFVLLTNYIANFKGQIISESIFFTNKKIWQISALAPKEWSNQKKIKALSYINYGLFNVKCLYFFLIWALFRCYGRNLSNFPDGNKVYSEIIWPLAMEISRNFQIQFGNLLN